MVINMKQITDGVWPTMLTPFTDDNKIDYEATERLIEWYIENKVDGIFAMCQSSEMFYLTLQEKLNIINFTIKTVNKRVPVIASGHTSFDIKKQISELSHITETGIDALVLITNILATEEKTDDKFKKSVEEIINQLPSDIPLGIYECPHPFKYLVSPQLLKWCSDTGRFAFLKDTCCDIDIIKEKINSIKGTDMKLFNANSATLLQSLQLGGAGFSGVMANFHPELYVWLVHNYKTDIAKAQKLQEFLSIASFVEYVNYPECAKVYLGSVIGMGSHTRRPFESKLTATNKVQMEHLRNVTKLFTEAL